MSENFKDIFDDVRRESLTESERARMRNDLMLHMSEHPAKAPLSIRIYDTLANVVDAFGAQRSGSLRFVPATLAMVFVIGLGTAYAAEGALPGEILYGVKIEVNEAVKGAFAVSESAQASWQTERLERRLEEAEVLVAEGLLTPVAQATLESEINSTVEAFDRNVASLALSADESAVAAVQSYLEASLIGHAEVLVALASSPGTEVDVQPIVRSVLAKAEAAQAARASNEASMAAKRDGKKIREAALSKKQHAVEVVNSVRAKANKVAAKVDATTTILAAEAGTAQAEQAIEEAEEKLKQGDYGSAFSNFQEAIRAAKTVEVHMDASEKFNTDVHVFTRVQGDADTSIMLMVGGDE